MKAHSVPCLLCLLLAAPLVQAGEVNKCVDAAGNITLTDEPCRTLKSKPAPGIRSAPPPPTAMPPAPLLPLPEKQYAAPPPPPPPLEPPRY